MVRKRIGFFFDNYLIVKFVEPDAGLDVAVHYSYVGYGQALQELLLMNLFGLQELLLVARWSVKCEAFLRGELRLLFKRQRLRRIRSINAQDSLVFSFFSLLIILNLYNIIILLFYLFNIFLQGFKELFNSKPFLFVGWVGAAWNNGMLSFFYFMGYFCKLSSNSCRINCSFFCIFFNPWLQTELFCN